MRRQRNDVFLPLPERGHVDADDVEPVVEVFAELPALNRLFEILVRRRDEPHVHLHGAGPAQPLELALLENAEHLGLGRRRHVPDLVEKQRAFVRQLEPTGPLPVGARERPALVAEQLRLEEALVEGGAVHLHERAVRTARVTVQRLGDELLPDARLAQNEDRRVRAGDLLDRAEDFLHLRAFTHDVLETRHDLSTVVRLDARQQPPVLDRALDLHLHLFEIERLEHVVVGPRLHGVDGRLDGAVGGHHETHGPLVEHLAALQDLQAVLLGHLVVRHEHVEHRFLESRKRRRAVRRFDDVPAAIAERRCDALAERALVFGHQHLLHACISTLPHATMGSRTVNSVPSPSRLATSMRPRCESTIFLAIDNQTPDPCFFEVKNG